MRTFLKKENLKKSILCLVYLILGVMFCIMPVKMFSFVESTLCFVLLIVGVIGILSYSILSAGDRSVKVILCGIACLILSIFMILVPRLFGIIVSIIIGFGGACLIVSGIKLKKQKKVQWISDLVVGIIVTLLAVLTIILSGTNSAKKIIAIFFGAMCLLNGIYSLVNLIILAKKKDDQTEKLETSEPAQKVENHENLNEKTQETADAQKVENETETAKENANEQKNN